MPRLALPVSILDLGDVSAQMRTVMQEHFTRLSRLAERGAAVKLRRIYEVALTDMQRKVKHAVALGAGDAFTAHAQRVAMAQLNDGIRVMVRRMGTTLAEHTRETRVESLHGLVKDIGRLEHSFTGAEVVLPIEESSVFAGIVEGRTTSLMGELLADGTPRFSSLALYGADMVGDMEEILALATLEGDSVSGAIARIEGAGDMEWYRAERIARTETSYAYNSVRADGMEAASEELPDLYQQWSEYVLDGAPLDDRVGKDSIALHGQIARTGKAFIMPDDSTVSDKMWGQRYMFPPNRPNDRATIVPWRAEWGEPGWMCVDGQRIAFADLKPEELEAQALDAGEDEE